MRSRWVGGILLVLAAAQALGCATSTPAANVDRISRSGIEFFTFLQTRGNSIASIRSSLPTAKVDTVLLVAPHVTNEELADFVRVDASGYDFEIFLRVIVSRVNHQVYRYIVRGDWRRVKMGYRMLSHEDLYDAIYLHTHPDATRILPVSLNDFFHAEAFPDVETLLVGDGIALEFEIAETDRKEILLDADGTRVVMERPGRTAIRNKEHLRRHQRDAEGATIALDRMFRERVLGGHQRVTLQDPEGMLVTFDRDVTLTNRLDATYQNAGIPLPAGEQLTRVGTPQPRP